MGIFLQPGANALEVAETVKNRVEELSQGFPAGLSYSVAYDTTRFVEVSIREVVKTLVEAMLLVFLVVYLFLQNWRATLIPIIAVPVSLIGTFAGLLMLGYSINTLTLFGMVLAIGIVVDDAIVVLENVERIMHEEKLNAREAAIIAMREVSGPVIAIVLVLVLGVRPDRLPRRAHRRAVPAVRDHDLDRGGDLGRRRADADAEPVRDDAEAPSTSSPAASSRRSTTGSRASRTATRAA